MHQMVATEQVMTNRNNVMERTSGGEENNHKRERENDPAVIIFHPKIEGGHSESPGKPIRLPYTQIPPRDNHGTESLAASRICA